VTDPAAFGARLSAVERRVDDVASDSAAVRHLAGVRDRDIADLAIKTDANRKAINALGVQTVARFDRLENEIVDLRTEMRDKFEQVDRGFIEMRGRFDETAAGMARIVDLLTARDDGS
jgi:hypothetical protein